MQINEPSCYTQASRQSHLKLARHKQSPLLFQFLFNLGNLFADSILEERQRFLVSTFPEKLFYKNGEFQTMSNKDILSLIFKPETFPPQAGCSIQLTKIKKPHVIFVKLCDPVRIQT